MEKKTDNTLGENGLALRLPFLKYYYSVGQNTKQVDVFTMVPTQSHVTQADPRNVRKLVSWVL